MSYENVRTYFEGVGLEDRIRVLEDSTATVELAAEAIGCEGKQIAKTLSFLVDDLPILIVAAGNIRVDNKKYKEKFGKRRKMIPSELVGEKIGHRIGGVCPFAVKPNGNLPLFSWRSSKLHLIGNFPLHSNEQSVIELSMEELERYSDFIDWVDVSKE